MASRAVALGEPRRTRNQLADDKLAAALSSCILFSSTWATDMSLRMQSRFWGCARSAGGVMIVAMLTSASRAELTLRIADYATAPMTGSTIFPSTTPNSAYLARLNFLADEPTNADRFFLNDLNGPLYIVDKQTKQFTPYLNFNGRTSTGLFDRLYFDGGFATGLVTFAFDPDYANNGKFYTIHVEQGTEGAQLPDNANYPNLNLTNYGVTSAIDQPGNNTYENILVEWTDANTTNSVFEGSARELMRITARDRIHPMGDIIFNPTAGPGDADWRVMYVAIGDAGNGEQTGATSTTRRTPQRLDALGGKILRIIPDLGHQTASSTVSPNGKYRVPNDNPFTSVANSSVRDEIYALGLRNPHRMSWDVNPENPAEDHLIVNDIGLHTWEEVNIIQPGGNYGYSQREGNQSLSTDNDIGSLPSPDLVQTYLTSSTLGSAVTPRYPVVQYGHGLAGQPDPQGDSISSGYVYRGGNIPSLYGKYVFGDITTGQLFWSDFDEMLAADDGNPNTMAAIHQIDVAWDNPATPPGELTYSVINPSGAVIGPMHSIVREGYVARSGQDPNLPGGAAVTGSLGRADIRIQVDDAGELYILSKSDGMIRYIVEAVGDADFNGDDHVDGADFLIWQRNLGTAGGLAQGDADGDGKVTGADLSFWRQQFEQAPESAVVPEPAAGLLGFAAFTALSQRRKRR
jgi:hypothetical protein